MDVLTDVLNTLKLRSTVYCRARLSNPWSLRFEPLNMAAFHVVDNGRCWLQLDDEKPATELMSGDVLLLPRGTGHVIGSDPNRAPSTAIRLDKDVPEGGQIIEASRGMADSEVTGLLCGTFDFEHYNRYSLLSLLPSLVLLRGHEGQAPHGLDSTLKMLALEVFSGRPGSHTLLNRLADVLFIQIVQGWLENESNPPPGWLGALRDAQIGAALKLIHAQPGRSWTVAGLAHEVAMSRSAFAARFTTLVGEPPLQYLLRWRMQLAAEMLHKHGLEAAQIAERVGYNSEITFSRAFKRQFKIAPGAYRRQQLKPVAS